jgi:hypothetical protein
MKVSTEIDNKFGYEKITQLVDNIPLNHEHKHSAHCLETINNMWFLGKRESGNAWKKADFDGFREKGE